MFEFSVNKKILEDAMKLAILSTENTDNLITGHSLFDVGEQTLKVLSTDKKSRSSKASMPASSANAFKFTTDPRKILKLIKTSEGDDLKFSYDPENMTAQIFLSEDKESFVALPSFDPVSYAPIEENFDKAYDLKKLNAGVFLGGIQFIKGFLIDKHQKFSNMFISKGVMYGANGNNKAAAFSSVDLEGLDELVFPMMTFPAITNMINTLDLQEVLISSSSNSIFVSSPTKDFSFGFTKVQMKMPKIPITVTEPDWESWTIDKTAMLKKLNRLHITGDSGLGVRLEFIYDKIQMTTVVNRPSKDSMPCKRLKGTLNMKCITEVRLIESALNQFGAKDLNFFIDKKMVIIHSKADLEIEENGVNVLKPFICAAALALSEEE